MTVDRVIVFGLEMMADVGIGAMAGTVARALTPENANKVMKACIFVGGVAAGGCVANGANAYIEDYADNLKTVYKAAKEKRALKKAAKVEKPIEVKAEEVIDETKEE